MTIAHGRLRPYPLVFVLGLGHSGSTLLGRLLDMHSRVLCVGELMRIDRAVKNAYPCSCGASIETCDFWGRHLDILKSLSSRSYKRFHQDLYRKLGASSGHDVIVDLSKTRVIRIMNSIFAARRKRFTDASFILLLRDPKGIRASGQRRKDKPIEIFLQRYVKWMKRFQKFAQRESSRFHTLTYEDLCRQPEKEIKKICHFIGIKYESAMLYPANKAHHFIHSSTSSYLKNLNALVVDERWRQELQKEDIVAIESAIHKLDLLRDVYGSHEPHKGSPLVD
jgi:hypothetical protein